MGELNRRIDERMSKIFEAYFTKSIVHQSYVTIAEIRESEHTIYRDPLGSFPCLKKIHQGRKIKNESKATVKYFFGKVTKLC